jgi:hypothetical protein
VDAGQETHRNFVLGNFFLALSLAVADIVEGQLEAFA